MKTCVKYLLMVLTLAMCSLHSIGEEVPVDTVYFYKSWNQMLNNQPEAFCLNPAFKVLSSYEVDFITDDNEVDRMIKENYIAISDGGSNWLLNSEYLRKNFKGDVGDVHGFAPVYFNDKTAFVVTNAPLSVKDVLLGNDAEGLTLRQGAYYYIDFAHLEVKRVTHKYLGKLLENYNDLQMRFEGMKDNKDQSIMEDFFFKYIDHATEDIMMPYIVDLMD